MKKGKNTNSHSANSQAAEFVPASLGAALLSGLICFASVSAALLLLTSFAAYKSSDPSPLMMPLGTASLLIGMLAGGFASSKKAGANKLMSALIFTTAALILLFVIKTVMINLNCESTEYSAIIMLVSAALSMIGALAATLSMKKSSARKKKKTNKFKK